MHRIVYQFTGSPVEIEFMYQTELWHLERDIAPDEKPIVRIIHRTDNSIHFDYWITLASHKKWIKHLSGVFPTFNIQYNH